MKQTATPMPTWLSRTLLYGLGLTLVLLPLHAFLSTWGGTALGPLWAWKSWKELLVVLLVLVTVGWLVVAKGILAKLTRDNLPIVLMCYVLVMAILGWAFGGLNGEDATLAGYAMNLRYLAFGVLAFLLFKFGGVKGKWLDRAAKFVIAAGVTVAVLGILQSLVLPSDFLSRFGYSDSTIAPATLVDDDPELLRAFATLRGPNDFGAYLILPIILVISFWRRLPLWVSGVLLAVLTWALVLSGSRSAWLGLVVALVVYASLAIGRRVRLRWWLAAAMTLLVVGIAGLLVSASVPALRQAIFHSSPGDPTLTEGSTDAHFAATAAGIKRVLDDPIGCGPGCAGPASYYGDEPRIAENYFVQIAEETGVIGLLLFVAIVARTAERLHRARSSLPLATVILAVLAGHLIIGLWLHVWADDPLSITWWLLAGAVIGYNERTPWKKSKNASAPKPS